MTQCNKIYIMEIERFAIHDGPGIRTTVFMQGCPLRCPWCANPESQVIGPHLMYLATKCLKCGTCIRNCPQKAIRIVGGSLVFDREKCIGCKTCATNCLANAICFIGEEKSVEEIIYNILKDKDYYDESNGGVTISGGEPFIQFQGFLSLLKRCKECGINTAVETTGDIEWFKIEKAFPYIDLFLFDIKHSDPKEVNRITGGNGYRIMENISKIAALDSDKIIIRMPVIPEYNYSDETIINIIDMGIKLNIPEINLLPYHDLGVYKYQQLGKKYTLQDIKMLDKKLLKKYEEIGKQKGIKVQVGG